MTIDEMIAEGDRVMVLGYIRPIVAMAATCSTP